MNRRNFVRNTGLAAAAFSLLPTSQLFSQSAKTKVRLAIIGVGLRGQNHLELALKRSDTEVVAICDINERMLTDSLNMIKKSGKAAPKVFKGDVNAWKKLLEVKDIDE